MSIYKSSDACKDPAAIEHPTPSVFVVILNWNGWQDTLNCLKSVEQSDYDNLNVILVDNASTDNSVEQLIKHGYGKILVQSDVNRGFSGGCNIGIKCAIERGADFVWLLNNDTVVNSRTLPSLVDGALASSYAATGSLIFEMDESDIVQIWGGGYYSMLTGLAWNHKKSRPLRFISGASILLSRDTIEKIGILDEDYFMYWEDIDLGYRIRDAKLSLGIVEDSQLRHKMSASVANLNSTKYRLRSESLVIFYRKHSHFPALPILIGISTRAASQVLRGNFSGARAILVGAIAGIRKKIHYNSSISSHSHG